MGLSFFRLCSRRDTLRKAQAKTLAIEAFISVGGTNCQYKFFEMGSCVAQGSERTENIENFVTFVRNLLHGTALLSLDVAAAGPVIDSEVKLPNADLFISGRELSNNFSVQRVRVFNDMAAVAAFSSFLSSDEVCVLKSGSPSPGSRKSLIVNVGTGFGAAFLIEYPHSSRVLALEPGHMTTPSRAGFRTGDLLIEDILSGPGLVRLASDFAENSPELTPEVIARRAREQRDGGSERLAFRSFATALGSVVRDLAILLRVNSKILLCGSVITENIDLIEGSSFVAQFGPASKLGDILKGVEIGVLLPKELEITGMIRSRGGSVEFE